jgi:hypothetical protein
MAGGNRRIVFGGAGGRIGHVELICCCCGDEHSMGVRLSTPEERSIAAYAAAFVLALIGCIALYAAWFTNAPAEMAVQLRNIAICYFGLAAGIVAFRWIIAYLANN